jgi:hypothetical protein
MVKAGDRIKLKAMPEDPDPIPAGSLGTVIAVEGGSFPQIDMKWDCHRSLSLIPGVDVFEIFGHEE